ncbi:hypothetical protein [Streptomyces sp. NBC_01237]|uniref:hypothetical protein n=1 Tax=Streptomyces sp. NBC_01237 TaxID=2903790 RepID=UPI002DDBD845|nr:hypothetical protein [Streptomyces sp. NBC_01237]WRZ76560.1 hypothetical protein OG251_35845 [Streptomyces sp. NBC_01237]
MHVHPAPSPSSAEPPRSSLDDHSDDCPWCLALSPCAAPAVEDRPVRTRETASDGYRAALAAHHTHRQSPVPAVDPAVQAARDQQIRNRLREPEELFGDGQDALATLRAKTAATTTGTRASDAAQARALQRLAAERAGLATITPAVAPGSLGLTG